jgi:PIN domain nuclease of toxin-antitoxin system
VNAGHEAKLLLDTHVWVWLMNGDDRYLGPDVVAAIEQAAPVGGVHISAISVWEVAMLESKGRIRIFKDCLEWVRQALDAPGVRLLPLSPEIAVASCRLPGDFHGDPADRILVASARLNDFQLVTYDPRIVAYGADRYVSVLTS